MGLRFLRTALFSFFLAKPVETLDLIRRSFLASRTWSHRYLTASTAHSSFSGRNGRIVQLSLARGDEESENGTRKSRVRFSGASGPSSSSSSLIDNPLDAILAFLTSDVGSIAIGTIGLFFLLAGRLFLDDSSTANYSSFSPDDVASRKAALEGLGQETRADLLAVLACGAVIVNGISKLDIESALAETVDLIGTEIKEPVVDGTVGTEDAWILSWAAKSLQVATPANTVVFLQASEKGSEGEGPRWKIKCAAGTVPSVAEDENVVENLAVPAAAPILDRFTKTGTNQETYLPTLQALPGRTEFTYLPANTQAVLLMPVNFDGNGSVTGVLALGSNQARSFTPRNIAWCQTLAARLCTKLSTGS